MSRSSPARGPHGTPRAASTAPSAPVHRWSTDDVPEAQRLDYYADALTSAIDPMGVARRIEGRFDAEITATSLGPIDVIRGIGSAHACVRTARDVARSGERNFHLILNRSSSWQLAHRTPVQLRPGDAVLLDARLGHHIDFLAPFDVVHLKLPEAWLSRWLADPGQAAGRAIAGDAGWGRALSAFMAQLSPEAAAQPPLPATLIADQLGGLLALCAGEIGPSPTPSARIQRALRDRIHECVVQRCTEFALVAADVATTLQVSPRTLHRCLAACSQTFGGMLMAARVELALRMLESPLLARLTTAEIGRRAGFSDASHFARVFRRHTGSTPAQVRLGLALAPPLPGMDDDAG